MATRGGIGRERRYPFNVESDAWCRSFALSIIGVLLDWSVTENRILRQCAEPDRYSIECHS
jgi:hypothetical protein